MGLKGIAKVAKGWFLRCDQSLDCRGGRSLADIVAYDPAAKPDYNSALHRFREVDFSLLADLSSHKDASVEDIINLLCLEGSLAEALGMSELQPDIEQLTFLI
nr:hypothetical protein [Tanacetum cinerariifolium]